MSEFRGRWEEWPPAKPIRVDDLFVPVYGGS